MNCSCIFIDIDDSPEFYTQTDPIARKHHECTECHRTINPKEQYRRVSGSWCMGIETYKTCSECMEIVQAFFCGGWNFGLILYDLKEHVNEMNGEISEDCLSDLSPKERAVVCEIIENVWERLE